MMTGQSGAALALTALAVFAFRAGGLVLAERLGPRSPVLAWANAVSYSMLAVYVVQTLIAPGSSLQATPTAARVAAALLAVAGFTALGRGLFQWLVIGTAAFTLGLGPARAPESVRTPPSTESSTSAPANSGADDKWQFLFSCSPSAALFALLHHPSAFKPRSGTSGCDYPDGFRLRRELSPPGWALDRSGRSSPGAGPGSMATGLEPLPLSFVLTSAHLSSWALGRRASETRGRPTLQRHSPTRQPSQR